MVSMLEFGRIKLSSPISFNDPWDCRPYFQLPKNASDKIDTMKYFEVAHRKRHPEISEEVRQNMIKFFHENPGHLSEAIVKLNEQTYKAICNQYRVYCLSERPDAALMWAHYAKSHTGICIEFDTSEPPFALNNYVSKVQYRKEYPILNVSAPGYEPLITKSIDWSYEKEWRLIAEERAFAMSDKTLKTDDDFFYISKRSLKSVIVGALAPNSQVEEIIGLIKKNSPNTIFRKASIAKDRYEVMISPPIS